MSRLPNIGLEALEEERQPGCCLACDKPLPPPARRPGGGPAGRPRVICDDPECLRVYMTAYKRGQRARRGKVTERPMSIWMQPPLYEATLKAALSEGVSLSEWWRRAARAALERRG